MVIDTGSRGVPAPANDEILANATEVASFAGEVIVDRLMSNIRETSKWFNVCSIDAITNCIRDLEDETGTKPDREKPERKIKYHRSVLAMLHCVNYSEIDPSVINKIPDQVFGYFALCGLDDDIGRKLCGTNRWDQLKADFKKFYECYDDAERAVANEKFSSLSDMSPRPTPVWYSIPVEVLGLAVLGAFVILIVICVYLGVHDRF